MNKRKIGFSRNLQHERKSYIYKVKKHKNKIKQKQNGVNTDLSQHCRDFNLFFTEQLDIREQLENNKVVKCLVFI